MRAATARPRTPSSVSRSNWARRKWCCQNSPALRATKRRNWSKANIRRKPTENLRLAALRLAQSRKRWRLFRCNRHRDALAAAIHHHFHRLALLLACHDCHIRRHVLNRLTGDLDNEIAFLDARLGRRASFGYPTDQDALLRCL